MKDEEQYLWDGTGPVDQQVQALEELLRPLGADQQTTAPRIIALPVAVPVPAARRKRYFAAAAVLLVSGIALWGTTITSTIELMVVANGQLLRPGTSFVASKEARVLNLGHNGRLGELTLDIGSRLRIDRLARNETVLSLERGRLDAFVSAQAKPGFFNVDTPATRCVDLGCAYELEVDANGNAFVHVRTGRVAFRDKRKDGRDERDVFVPAGAVCRAKKGIGAGTPRFMGSAQQATLDSFDASSDPIVRKRLATLILNNVQMKADLLPVWHFLQDEQADIAIAASQHLRKSFAKSLPALQASATERPTDEDRSIWREKLWPDPYN